MLPVLLICWAGMFTGNACWCWSLGCRDEGGRGRVRREWLMGSTGDMDRGEGRLYLGLCCSTREESERLILGEQRECGKFCGQPTWSSGRVGLWLNRECPPEMGAGTQQ